MGLYSTNNTKTVIIVYNYLIYNYKAKEFPTLRMCVL